ncbi:MAG TPA: PrgI family protein [Candidatus Saccharimonadales bacterium]|nr:PrgI family protein [Candidatus Saccharimonadales bacterium]
MDNHPIPQDVTGFQFRLIGDMTLKQFAYLAAGVILAWICLALPVFFLIKFILVAIFAGSGALLAFIPIGGRPADSMLLFFLKALFSPSQFVYQQAGAQAIPPQIEEKEYVKQQKHEEKKAPEEKKNEKIHFEAFPAAIAQTVLQDPPKAEKSSAAPVVAPLVATPVVQKQVDPDARVLSQEVKEVQQELEHAKEEEKTKEGTALEAGAHQKVAQLEDEMETILKQKQALEQQLLALEQRLAQKQQNVFTPSTIKEEPQETAHVRKVPANMGTVVGAPFTNDVPNLIIGVIKDARGNVLPNILIEVKDKDNNPVRAFKTNPLGQFASATPILNGVYTMTFEDPQNKQKFDAIEITANGEVMLPLEVISTDERENLRKELFGT